MRVQTVGGVREVGEGVQVNTLARVASFSAGRVRNCCVWTFFYYYLSCLQAATSTCGGSAAPRLVLLKGEKINNM